MSHLADLVTDLQRTDPGRPRITWYVADGGPGDGERVELSGAVLANWASKAANLLQDELDAGPGSRVVLDLPPHWRSLYWAVATWATGASVATEGDGDVVVTTDPATAPDGDLVVVTLAALARAATVAVPAGAIDEARELASHGDRFVALDRPGDAGTALEPALPFALDGTDSTDGARRLVVVRPSTSLRPWLGEAARTLAAGGSLVVVRVAEDADPGSTPLTDRIAAIRAQERTSEAEVSET